MSYFFNEKIDYISQIFLFLITKNVKNPQLIPTTSTYVFYINIFPEILKQKILNQKITHQLK